MIPVNVVGMGLTIDDLPEKLKILIDKADVIFGGKRYLDYFKETRADKFPITKDIPSIVIQIKQRMEKENIVVLASGDPLFYGIGTTLLRELGQENIIIHPNITSVAFAFAAIKEPWQEASLISLHGRNNQNLDSLLGKKKLAAILTDSKHTPSWIANHLISNGFSNFKMCVLENLGNDSQKISWHDTLDQVADKDFSMPNVVILKQNIRDRETAANTGDKDTTRINNNTGSDQAAGRHQQSAQVYPGMPEDRFFHENGLITKSEIRSIVLSKLKLVSDHHIFWDLGSGSGSVSIEVSRFITKGDIFALEKNPDRISLIRKNIKNFNIPNITAVQSELPMGMDLLPDPDRIFIGGGGRNLLKIINHCATRLPVNGVIVINTVLLQNVEPVVKALKGLGIEPELIQVQVSRSKPMPFGDRLEALNPVWIISGEKKETIQ